jgi:hypothetical protein
MESCPYSTDSWCTEVEAGLAFSHPLANTPLPDRPDQVAADSGQDTACVPCPFGRHNSLAHAATGTLAIPPPTLASLTVQRCTRVRTAHHTQPAGVQPLSALECGGGTRLCGDSARPNHRGASSGYPWRKRHIQSQMTQDKSCPYQHLSKRVASSESWRKTQMSA